MEVPGRLEPLVDTELVGRSSVFDYSVADVLAVLTRSTAPVAHPR